MGKARGTLGSLLLVPLGQRVGPGTWGVLGILTERIRGMTCKTPFGSVKTLTELHGCKHEQIFWQRELTEITLIAQCSAPRAMEATETGAAVYQVWEAPTARNTVGSVERLHGAQRRPFR